MSTTQAPSRLRGTTHLPRVLVCDHELQVVRALRVVLRGAGFDVHATQTAEDALDHAALRAPDVAIVEMLLPDGNGVDLCRQLRAWGSAALVVLSAVDDEEQKVRALDAGADDYLLKPFGPRELVARLNAILRRAGAGGGHPRLGSDGFEIDLAARVLWSHGEEVHLTPIEFRLLHALLANPGRLITHHALLKHAWGAAHAEDRQTLRAHMANLRRKLGSTDEQPLIRTYHGVGYLFEGKRGEQSITPPRPRFKLAGRSDVTVDRRPEPSKRARLGATRAPLHHVRNCA